MIRTKNVILKPNQIDSEWAFNYLLGPLELSGGDTKISSPFSTDRTPSFSIYKKSIDSAYMYSCFSSGMKGSCFDLLIELQKLKGVVIDKNQAVAILKREFEATIKTGDYAPIEAKVLRNGKGKVVEHQTRVWNDDDIVYWSRFETPIDILEFFNIAPLKSFTMEKLVDGEMKRYDFDHPRIYGYFRNNGSLHKIYRPGTKKGKFIKVGNEYTQGADQIITPNENLIYIKSLKDVACFKSLDISGWDTKAPDAEGILIPKKEIEQDKKTYKRILSWMDPDEAGKKATKKYKEVYEIEPVDFDMGVKDLSDSVERWGGFLVKIKLTQILWI